MRTIVALMLGFLAAVGLAQGPRVVEVRFDRNWMSTHQPNRVTLVLSEPAPAGTVARVEDDSNLISTPKLVSFQTGSTEAAFPIYCGANYQGSWWEYTVVNVRASISGSPEASGALEITPSPVFSYAAVQANYSDYLYDVYGGDRFLVMVTILPEGCGTFTFTDSSPIVSGLPPQSLCDYSWFTLYTLPVAFSTPVFLQAHNGGFVSEWPITVHPRPRLTGLDLIPPAVSGGSSVTGRLTLDRVGRAGPLSATVSDSSILVTTPSAVEIPGGVASQDFTISTLPVHRTYTVTVKARMREVTKTAVLTLNP